MMLPNPATKSIHAFVCSPMMFPDNAGDDFDECRRHFNANGDERAAGGQQHPYAGNQPHVASVNEMQN